MAASKRPSLSGSSKARAKRQKLQMESEAKNAGQKRNDVSKETPTTFEIAAM
jgi:hypothetical protein